MPLDHFRDNFAQQRKRAAFDLQNPRLMKISFKTLRTWGGTWEYHRTKDILYVMQLLGHKNIKNTLIYIQLEEALFKNEVEYISKVAKTETMHWCLSRLGLNSCVTSADINSLGSGKIDRNFGDVKIL
jgi:hypothetical protein